MRLQNKVAIITGGASGIGREICIRFGSEGAEVIIVDNNPRALDSFSAELNSLSITHVTKVVDVRDEDQITSLMAECEHQYRKLDVLVNAAGILGPMSKPIDQLTIEDWDQTLGINLVGMSLVMKHAIPLMKKSGGGSMINFASTAGLNPIDGAAPYCVSKAGVIMLTRVAALEYGQYNIRVNTICPDKIDTPMMDTVVSHLEDIGLTKARESIASGTVLNRFGSAKEVASLALFLACNEDSSFVTGSSMVIDGGSTCT